MKATTRLRQMLDSDEMVVAPFVLNALHAKIAESVGFQAVYMTGAGTAAERGFPDVGLLTMTEMVTNAKYIANAVDIPVICDSDSGFGNPLNVRRAVQEYEAAGVAAIHIEDQVFPKKCGFFEGKQVIPLGGPRQQDPRRPGRSEGPRLRDHRPLRRLRRHRLGGHHPPLPGLHRGRGGRRLRRRHQERRGHSQLCERPWSTSPACTTAT